MDYHPSNGSAKPSYKTKLHQMQKLVRRYVIINAALCDQVSETQEQLVIAKENRRFLLERLQRLSNQQECVPQAPPPKPVILNLPSLFPIPSCSQTAILSYVSEEVIPLPKKKPKQKKLAHPKVRKAIDCNVIKTGYELQQFPLMLRGLTVFCVGKAKDYETQKVGGVEFLVPMDYQATRIYGNLSDPETRCRYNCIVNSPLNQSRMFCSQFEISCTDLDKPISGRTADECHAKLIRMINEVMGAPVITQQPKGEWFFGYALPEVRRRMGTTHTFRATDAAGCKIDEENDDSLQFEALQRSIAVARFEAQSGAAFSRSPQIIPVSDQWEV